VTARAAWPRLRRLAAGAVVALVLAAPRAAQACFVCMSGRDDDSGRAFLFGSVLLSLLPFALFGGIGLFVWRRVRAAERARAREAQAELRA
jgi:hypothetical protein